MSISSLGRASAPCTKAECLLSGPGFESDLQPVAARHAPSLSHSCHSSASQSNKACPERPGGRARCRSLEEVTYVESGEA